MSVVGGNPKNYAPLSISQFDRSWTCALWRHSPFMWANWYMSARDRHPSRSAVRVSGHRELKDGAAGHVGARPQPTTVVLDDGAADRQTHAHAHAHAHGLGGVESFEQAVCVVRAQPRTGVPHRHEHAV
jgi:hypothetical protein